MSDTNLAPAAPAENSILRELARVIAALLCRPASVQPVYVRFDHRGKSR